jgi:hypothetical protein
VTVRHRETAPVAMLFVAMLVTTSAAAACGAPDPDDAPWSKRAKPASFHSDSTRIVALAMRALGDSIPMRVDGLTKGVDGWQVRLLPVRGGTVGGGLVWVETNDSSATVVKRY